MHLQVWNSGLNFPNGVQTRNKWLSPLFFIYQERRTPSGGGGWSTAGLQLCPVFLSTSIKLSKNKREILFGADTSCLLCPFCLHILLPKWVLIIIVIMPFRHKAGFHKMGCLPPKYRLSWHTPSNELTASTGVSIQGNFILGKTELRVSFFSFCERWESSPGCWTAAEPQESGVGEDLWESKRGSSWMCVFLGEENIYIQLLSGSFWAPGPAHKSKRRILSYVPRKMKPPRLMADIRGTTPANSLKRAEG